MNRRRLADVLRAALFLGISAALAASASSSSNAPPTAPYGTAPPAQAMDPARTLGLWKSSFGAVKIEEDASKPAGSGFVHGIWSYDRQGQQVIGYFGGNLRGNVLQFAWNEPAVPRDLVGQGYLVFDPSGQRFSGQWWTTTRDRNGVWNGWRQEQQPAQPDPYNRGYDPYGRSPQPDPYGGATYGYGYPPPPPSSPY